MSADALALMDLLDLFVLCVSISLLTVSVMLIREIRSGLADHRRLVDEARQLTENFRRIAGEAQDAHQQWVGEIQKLKDKVTAMSMTLKR